LGGSQFQASLGKKVPKTPPQQKKLSTVAHSCHPSDGRKRCPMSKVTSKKGRGGVAQVVESLPSVKSRVQTKLLATQQTLL
jgi:hypothetical protein